MKVLYICLFNVEVLRKTCYTMYRGKGGISNYDKNNWYRTSGFYRVNRKWLFLCGQDRVHSGVVGKSGCGYFDCPSPPFWKNAEYEYAGAFFPCRT